MGGQAGQGHGADILHDAQARGCEERLGRAFWKHTDIEEKVQGGFPRLLPRPGPQGFPRSVCMCRVCVCVCVIYRVGQKQADSCEYTKHRVYSRVY